MAKHVLIVLTNAKDGADETFNKWYTDTHIGDILAIDGFSAAQRFKLSESQMGGGETPYGYLALYEIDAAEASTAVDALMKAVPNLEMTDAFDPVSAAWVFSPINERVTADEVATVRAAT